MQSGIVRLRKIVNSPDATMLQSLNANAVVKQYPKIANRSDHGFIDDEGGQLFVESADDLRVKVLPVLLGSV